MIGGAESAVSLVGQTTYSANIATVICQISMRREYEYLSS